MTVGIKECNYKRDYETNLTFFFNSTIFFSGINGLGRQKNLLYLVDRNNACWQITGCVSIGTENVSARGLKDIFGVVPAERLVPFEGLGDVNAQLVGLVLHRLQ